MAGPGAVLRPPGHRLLLHHLPASEDHPGNALDRDQRHSLLFPDALSCAPPHLPPVSMVPGVASTGGLQSSELGNSVNSVMED